jgi:hypothetical protein
MNIPPSTFRFLPHSVTTLWLELPAPFYCGRNMGQEDIRIDIPDGILEGFTSFNFSCSWAANHVFKVLRTYLFGSVGSTGSSKMTLLTP